MIRNYIYSLCGNMNKAEDLCQDAFLKLWNNCAKVPLNNAKAFLFRVVKNAFYNMAEHDKVVLKFLSANKNRLNEQDPEYILREKQFQEKLNTAINNLGEKERVVFLMNRIDNKKYREIAELLDISIKTVEKRMHDALLYLKNELGNYKL